MNKPSWFAFRIESERATSKYLFDSLEELHTFMHADREGIYSYGVQMQIGDDLAFAFVEGGELPLWFTCASDIRREVVPDELRAEWAAR